MKKTTNLKALFTIALSLIVVIVFQNCAPNKSTELSVIKEAGNPAE